ncbi:unnamed protein product [Moneuplotes crassus]|uniref:DUF726 domain-containing protein n=1 Tax=Euplotes crassus TaxID=5936 RepID=A0AAD2D9X8_EUPCR|nr:unnamed protein product [Moneuplotes crassus]
MKATNRFEIQDETGFENAQIVITRLELIVRIGAFFEKKEGKASFEKYLENIGKLENETEDIINGCLEDIKSSDTSLDSSEDEVISLKSEVDKEEAHLREDLTKTKKELRKIRDDLILSFMKEFHPGRYSEVNSQIATYTGDHISKISIYNKLKTKSYEDSSAKPRKVKSFVRSHKPPIINSIKSELPIFPEMISSAFNLKFWDDAGEAFDYTLGLASSSEEVQSFANDFSKFLKKCPKIPWKSAAFDIETSQVIQLFTYFYLCQTPKSKADQRRIQDSFSGLVEWYAYWAETQGEDSEEIIHQAHQDIKNLSRAKSEQLRQDIFDKGLGDQRYFVIWNIAIYLLGIVEDKHDIHYKVNQAALDYYMSNFLAHLYPGAKGKEMYLMLYKKISKIFYGSNKDMFSSSYYKDFIASRPPNTVDYVAFMDQITTDSDFQKEYIQAITKEFKHKDTNLTAKILKKMFKESAELISDNDGFMAKFECITPNVTFSKHAIIAISGWTSETNDSQQKNWQGMIDQFIGNSNIPIYAFSYAASTIWDVLKAILKPGFSSSMKWFIKTISKTLGIAAQGIDVINKVRKQFIECMKMAEATGKVLAHSLMSQFPFKDTSITLLGFSLGTQVIYSCLEELKAYECDHIINNVYFLGGAASVTDSDAWKHSLSVTNGVNNNCYCTSDYILQICRATLFQYPIGLGPILKDDHGYVEAKEEEDDSRNGYRLANLDVTKEASGHVFYRGNMEKILDKIDFIG